MALEIFKLVGSIMVDNAKANESIAKTDEKAQGVGSTLSKGISTASKWGVAIAGATTVMVGAMTKSALSTAEATDEIDKMSQRLGISREGYQKLDYVLSQSGVEVNSFSTGMKTLLAQMDKVTEGNSTAIDNFAKLGVEVTNANGTMKSQEEVLNDTIRAFQSMDDSAEKSRLAQELFGKQGQEILPLLNSEAGSYDKLSQKAKDLGLVLGDDVIDAGVQLTDTIDTMKKSFATVGVQIGGAFMPILTNVCQFIIDNIPTINALIEKLEPIAQQLFETLVPSLMQIAEKLLPPLLALVEALLPFIVQIADALLPFIVQILTSLSNLLISSVIPNFQKFGGWLMDVFVGALKVVISITENVLTTFKKVFGALVDVVKPPINAILKLINKLIDALNSIHIDIPDWVPGFGGQTFGINIPKVPLLAKGGEVLSNGSAIVGEAGAELVDLPVGAKVTPLTRSENGGSVEQKIEQMIDLLQELIDVMPSAVAQGVSSLDISWNDRELGRLVRAYER